MAPLWLDHCNKPLTLSNFLDTHGRRTDEEKTDESASWLISFERVPLAEVASHGKPSGTRMRSKGWLTCWSGSPPGSQGSEGGRVCLWGSLSISFVLSIPLVDDFQFWEVERSSYRIASHRFALHWHSQSYASFCDLASSDCIEFLSLLLHRAIRDFLRYIPCSSAECSTLCHHGRRGEKAMAAFGG